jgi:hypothetical protein
LTEPEKQGTKSIAIWIWPNVELISFGRISGASRRKPGFPGFRFAPFVAPWRNERGPSNPLRVWLFDTFSGKTQSSAYLKDTS